MDLGQLPSTAIALALGYQAGRPVAVVEAGRVSALVDELIRRGEYDAMLAALGPDFAQRVAALYMADRGQVWARTGRR